MISSGVLALELCKQKKYENFLFINKKKGNRVTCYALIKRLELVYGFINLQVNNICKCKSWIRCILLYMPNLNQIKEVNKTVYTKLVCIRALR